MCRPKGTKPKAPSSATAGRLSAGQAAKPSPAGRTTPGKPVSLDGCSVPGLEIKTRHHFSSKLQRMSTVARTQVSYGSGWLALLVCGVIGAEGVVAWPCALPCCCVLGFVFVRWRLWVFV